jgi:hypothetical protein
MHVDRAIPLLGEGFAHGNLPALTGSRTRCMTSGLTQD